MRRTHEVSLILVAMILSTTPLVHASDQSSDCLREAVESMTDINEAYQALARHGINLDFGTSDMRDLSARIVTKKASLRSKRVELKQLRTSRKLERDHHQKDYLQIEIDARETEIAKEEIELTQAESDLSKRQEQMRRFINGDDSALFGQPRSLLEQIIQNDQRRGLRPGD